MKKILLLVITLAFLQINDSFAESTDSENTEEQTQSETQKTPLESLKEKLAEIYPKNIKIYEFNPVKNPQGIINIVEFNDLGCYDCLLKSKKVYDTIGPEYIKDIKWVYKHTKSQENSSINKAALYGRVAYNYKRFWDLKKALTEKEYKTDDSLIALIMSFGVSQKDLFDKLLNLGDKYYKQIDVDQQYADSIKGSASPMFFVDGYRINQEFTLPEMLEYIKLRKNEWLKEKKRIQNKYKVGKF